MFGRDIVLIPTKPLPLGYVFPCLITLLLEIGTSSRSRHPKTDSSTLFPPSFTCRPEYAAWAGMIVAHYGKNGGTLGTEGQLRATSAAALSELRGYYSTTPTPDNRTPDFSDEDEYDGVFASRGRTKPLPGEVELMARQTSSQSTPGYIDDRLRRRRNADDDYLIDEPLEGGSMFSNLRIPGPARIALFRSATDRLSRESQPGMGNGAGNQTRSATVGVGLNDLKDWHRKSLQWRSQLLNKIKRVASQPVMSSGGAPGSMAQAAEAALALATGLSGGVGGGGAPGQKEGRKAD